MNYTTPTKKEAQLFADELRSGKYTQSKNSLQTNDGYCCLGVGCKVFIPEDKIEMNHNGLFLYGDFPDEQIEAPDWLKVINYDFEDKTGKSLSHLNDCHDYTFDMIADLIELVYVHGALD